MKLKRISIILLLGLLSLSSCNNQSKEVQIKSELEIVSYCLGINVGVSIKDRLDEIDVNAFAKALDDVFNNRELLYSNTEAIDIAEEFLNKVTEIRIERENKIAEKNKEEGEKFLERNAKKPGVVTLESGLQYLVIKEGDGPRPKLTDKITAHYHGTLIDNTVFNSSVEKGEPLSIGVNQLITGWTEAVQLMRVGAKWKLFIPADLAYGSRRRSEIIGPNSVLIFEMELLSIDKNE